MFREHPSIIHAAELAQLCAPLKIIDITTFSHLRVFNNNQLTVQCNHPQFLLNYLHKKYYAADPCVNINPEPTDIGEYILWDTVHCGGKTAEMLADSTSFDFKHVFTIIKKHKEFTDFYHFGTHLSNPAIHQLYINNLDLLDRFITFFSAHVQQSKSLSHAYDLVLNAVQTSSAVELIAPKGLLSHQQSPRQMLLQKLMSSEQRKLTTHEIQCMELIIEGKTAKEIARILGLSYRTVEDRTHSLKEKFNAKNKTELVVKLLGKNWMSQTTV
jgi:DNA-binding CsgD family transcriptional regulator